MRERKYVKFRVDMLSDTKAKIIDRKPERDLIHYVWMALVLLSGKVNLYGELYLSKNIPYTIETLAIELNRDIDQVRLALDTLIELEMMELEGNIYKVKNFAKHQNIKVKEKSETKETTSNDGKQLNKDLKGEGCDNKYEELENNIGEAEKENLDGNIIKLESTNSATNSSEKTKDYVDNKNIIDDSKDKSPIVLEVQKNRKADKGNSKDKPKKNRKDKSCNIAAEEIEDEPLLALSDGERTLMEDEEAIAQWSF